MGSTGFLASEARETSSREPLTVGAVTAQDRARWDTFLASQPLGSYYHLYDWKSINESELGHTCEYVAARTAAGDIEGVLPLVFVKSRIFGRILCSMPFVNLGGPVASSPEAAALLARHGAARAADLRADYLELRCAAPLQTSDPASLKKVSMTLTLTSDPEELWKKFTSKHRTNVRRAQKNDLQVRSGGQDLLPVFYSVLERSWHSLGTPLYPMRYFHRILETFPELTRIFVCYHKDTPIAATFNGHFNGTVEGMWAGALPEHRQLQPNYVLYWEMIKDACERGYKRFHLGRSTADSGAEQFKSKWNAEIHQLYWYFHRPNGGEMPGLNVDNPKYQLAIATWRRLPLWLTRMVGPPLARLIP